MLGLCRVMIVRKGYNRKIHFSSSEWHTPSLRMTDVKAKIPIGGCNLMAKSGPIYRI